MGDSVEMRPVPSWLIQGDYVEPIGSKEARVPQLEIDDANTYIDKDDSNNMTFTDAVTGTKTLAQLGSGTRGVTLVVAGANATTLEKAGADYLCDGTADNVEIQAAISALPADGGTVKLIGGIFNISAPIIINTSGISMIGEAEISTLYGGVRSELRLANGVNDSVIKVEDATETVLMYFSVNANGANQTAGHGIWIHNAHLSLFSHLDVSYAKESGIYVDDADTSNETVIEYIQISGLNLVNAIDARGLVQGWILNSYLRADNGSGIYVNNADNFISGNHIGIAQYGINGGTGADFSVVTGNTISDTVVAAINWIGSDSAISNNRLYNVGQYGIRARGGRDAVTGNTIYGPTEAGIFSDIYGMAITGNVIIGDAIVSGGVWGDGITDSTVTGNVIRIATSGYGMAFTGATADVIVANNSLYGPASAGTALNTRDTADKILFADNSLNRFSSKYGNTSTGIAIVFRGNIGYIRAGETQSFSGSLTAGVANAICFAWNNPYAQDILIKKVVIEVTTAGGTTGSQLDVGIADDATGTNRGTEFFNDLLLNTVQVNDSTLNGDGGMQTKWVLCEDSASATDDWIVGQILTQNAASLVGKYYIEYVGR